MDIQEHISLKPFNTFGVAAQARYYTRITEVQALKALVKDTTWQHHPRVVLGGGSNLLFVKNFDGLVIHMALGGITMVKEDRSQAWIKAGAGVNWHALVLHCIAQGYAGIENLSLIPGTVGAAPVQNIGAYGVELCDVFDSLEAMEISSGVVRTFSRADCAFAYRSSIFKNDLKGKYIILGVTLRLQKHPTFRIDYEAVRATLAAMNVSLLTVKAVSDAIIHIRQQKLPDPARLGNAGSFFKNPLLSLHQYTQLKEQHPDIPGYTQSEQIVKVPAAWLIEQCGWKGKRKGAVGVHDEHALVLVNYGE